ncbi:uncharacterized protein Lint-O [Chelonus insularis]|uniref:uncharacterized protein Lint-O n=1 Tax=Chelonus insularis TaxID=460826 RepID=UPI00158D358C|nr:uncharacterized protein LOC118070444 [Chelonus insularis]XP_034944945.1 uncharacterized protein LOC118070444 [Chelonus insularis]
MQQFRIDVQIVHEEQILEAIDQLRRRKARPDADRICNYLLRKFSVDARDTIADLHRLIEAEKVIQVDYKGNTSYRNASKWSKLQLYKNRPEGFVKEKLNSAMVAGAVAELVVEEPDYLDQGVPAYRLIEQLLDGISNPTSRKMVEDFLNKEVANSNITKLANGNYSLVATSDMANTASGQAQSHDQNHFNQHDKFDGDSKNSRRSSRESGDSGKDSGIGTRNSGSADSFECNSLQNGTSSDTSSKPRQTSPRPENSKREHGNEAAIAGKEPNSPEASVTKDVNNSQRKEANASEGNFSNHKRSSKSERKQRLLVRADDSMDVEINFEEFEQQSNKKERGRKRKVDHSGDNSEEKEDDDGERESANPSPTTNATVGGFRSARRKRAKKVFDPSDNVYVAKRKRGRQPGSGQKASVQAPSQDSQDSSNKSTSKDTLTRQCSLCSKEKSEPLVACRDCTVRAHRSCIYSPEELSQKSKSNWQCDLCKTCTVCCETSDVGPLVTCSTCDEAYHHGCHVPRLNSIKSNSKWNCSECVQNQKQSSKSNARPETPSQTTTLPPVLSPQVSPTRDSVEDDTSPREAIDPNIPDASDWTSEQVYQYFARLFPKEAEVFRLQDIDGHSLLLMKRADVLIGLDLLLGPALKIYRHVLKLQMRRDETRFYWL